MPYSDGAQDRGQQINNWLDIGNDDPSIPDAREQAGDGIEDSHGHIDHGEAEGDLDEDGHGEAEGDIDHGHIETDSRGHIDLGEAEGDIDEGDGEDTDGDGTADTEDAKAEEDGGADANANVDEDASPPEVPLPTEERTPHVSRHIKYDPVGQNELTRTHLHTPKPPTPTPMITPPPKHHLFQLNQHHLNHHRRQTQIQTQGACAGARHSLNIWDPNRNQ